MLESDTHDPTRGERAPATLPWSVLTVLLPLLLLVGSGRAGLDYGTHWDENKAFLQPLRAAAEEGILLPGRYNYPSLGFALSVAALAPEALDSVGADAGFVPALRAKALALLPGGTDKEAKVVLAREGPAKIFLLRLRWLFLLASALAVLWVHLTVLARGGSALEALLASSLLGLSFEVAYHLRWVAPDGLLMEAAALTVLLATLSMHRSRSMAWVLGAAVAAGLGCASKYPGVLLLIPASLAALRSGLGTGPFTAKGLGKGALRVLAVVVVFAVAFTSVCPAIFLDSEPFWADIDYERTHYTQGTHFLHTVEAGWEHLAAALHYLGYQGLSHSPLLALLLSLLVLLGAWRMMREDRWGAALLILMPLVYLAYLSSVRVFLVRNLIVLLPFMALLAARGGAWLLKRSPEKKRAVLAATLLGVLYITNGSMLIGAARSIGEAWPEQALRDLAADLREQTDEPIYVTPSIRKGLQDLGLAEGLEHLTGKMSEGITSAVAYRNEIGGGKDMRWGFRHDFIRWYGSREVNLTYYPTWSADKLMWISTNGMAEHDLYLRSMRDE